MRPRLATLVALLACIALPATAAAQGSIVSVDPNANAATGTEPAASTAADGASTTQDPGQEQQGATVGDYRPSRTFVYDARLVTRVGVRPKPGGGRLIATMAPWIGGTGNPVDLLILDGTVMVRGVPWIKVLLPNRPNGSTGWIKQDSVVVHGNPMRIRISLSQHLLQVFRKGTIVHRVGVALGAPSTPTPRGHFAIYQKVREPSDSPLAPWALHLTAHSNVLFEFAGGPGRVAIHGARGSLWAKAGTNPSHGCIRVPDPGIGAVANLVSPGTPVDIVA
ncbi:MAG: L,D-transpeptidase [Gaiellales bacterium]